MNIDGIIALAKKIHDVEHYDLGASSSREYRNRFWARVIGCAYHGHPVYNPSPDRQWHIKKAGPTSPQSDDVCVSMPSRQAWDCISGAGAPGYRFESDAIGVLPSEQVVYEPPVPDGSGTIPVPPVPPPPPAPPHVCQTLGRDEALDELNWLDAYYRSQEGLQRPNGLSLDGKPDFLGIAAFYLDVYEKERITLKRSRAEARAAYVSAIRHTPEWIAKHPGETP